MAFACSTFGCSLLFTNGPGSEEAPAAEKIPPDCSTSRIPPIADTTLAAFQAVRTGLAIGARDSVYDGSPTSSEDESPISREVDIGIGITWVALYTASAVYGFSNTAACDAAKKKVADRRPARLQRAAAPAAPVERPVP